MRHTIVVLLAVLFTAISSTVSAVPHKITAPAISTEDALLDADVINKENPGGELADGYYVAENDSDELVLFSKDGTSALAAVLMGERGGLCIKADVHGNILDSNGIAFLFAQNNEGRAVTQDVREATAQIDLSRFTVSKDGSAMKNTGISEEERLEGIRGAINECAALLNALEKTNVRR